MKPRTWQSVRVAALLAVAISCGDPPEAPLEPQAILHSNADPSIVDRLPAVPNVGQLILDVVDEDCTIPAHIKDPRTPLFLVPLTLALQGVCDSLFPILAPDGRQVTNGQWIKPRGSVRISCEAGGTSYEFRFRGLIPNGVYTIWHFGTGWAGALASTPDDINNTVVASRSGTGTLSAFGTGGPATFFGEVPACTLPVPPRSQISDPAGAGTWFVVVYHTDNLTYGGFPGPEDVTVAHVVFFGT